MSVDSTAMYIPFFTVIICTYQRAFCIERAIDSLLEQTESDWEAVVIDDESTDGTIHILQKYGEADSRIRFIEKKHEGVAQARNLGIANARGLFVTFLDSDDEYRPDHLASRRAMILGYPNVELLHGGVTVIGSPMVIDKDDPTKLVHVDDCIVGGTFFIRRTVFEKIGGFDNVEYADDTMFHKRASQQGIVIARTDHASYIYHRDTPGALTSSYGQT